MAETPSDKPRPKHRRRRLLINAFALVLGLSILLMWAPYLVPDSLVTGRVRRELDASLPVPFELAGASLRGWTRLELRGLALGQERMVAAERIRVDVRLFSLLGESVRLRRVAVKGLSVAPRFLPDGRLNLEELFRAVRPGAAPVAVERIVVSDLNVDLRALAPERAASLALDVDVRRQDRPDAYEVQAAGALALDGQTLPTRFGGRFCAVKTPEGTGRARVLAIENGRITLGPPSSPDEFNLNDLDCILVSDPFGVRLDGRLELAGTGLNFSLSHCGPPDRRVTGADLSGASFDARGLCALLERLVGPGAGTEKAGPRAPRAAPSYLPALRKLRGRAELAFRELIVPAHRLVNVRRVIAAGDGKITATGPPVGYNNGIVDVAVSLDVTSDEVKWATELQARQVEPQKNVQPLLDLILPSVRLLKPFDLDAKLTGSGFSEAALCSSVHGPVSMGFGGGYVDFERPPAYVTGVFPSLDTTKLAFKKSAGMGQLKGNVVDFDVRFHTDIAGGVNTFAKGRADLVARTHTVDFGVDTLASLGAKLKPESTLKVATDIVVLRMTGSFDQPVEYQWYEVQADNVASVFKAVLREPLVMLDPTVSASEKYRHLKKRVQDVVGVAVKPLIFTSDLLEGANDAVRGFLKLLIGEDDQK